MSAEIIGMIVHLILTTVLIINIIYTIKLVKDYKINTKVCKYLLDCWEKKNDRK